MPFQGSLSRTFRPATRRATPFWLQRSSDAVEKAKQAYEVNILSAPGASQDHAYETVVVAPLYGPARRFESESDSKWPAETARRGRHHVDVAERAGVSVSTVSRPNRCPRVSPEIVDRSDGRGRPGHTPTKRRATSACCAR